MKEPTAHTVPPPRGVKVGVDRRMFLSGAISTAAGFLLAACAGPPQRTTALTPGSTASTPGTAASGTPRAGKLSLPTYVPFQGPKAEYPAVDPGVESGFLSYPKTLVKSVPQPPGTGGEVTAFTQTVRAVPAPVDQNPAWQAINKALNTNVKLQLTPSVEYATKVATLMAGSDIPDIFWLPARVVGIPQFVKSTAADLTDYVTGDAIKDYPNLAALPTDAWRLTLYDGAIYGVPQVYDHFNRVWYVNQSLLDTIGATQPKNAEDFKRILSELTRPQEGVWGIGQASPDYGLLGSGKGDSPQLAMFGGPNNWAVSSDGKFTKDFESEQFKAALGYVRDLYASGLFFPDALNTAILQNNFLARKFAVMTHTWPFYGPQFWDSGSKLTPPLKVRTLHPFSHDGSKPVWHRYAPFNGPTAIKKGSPERVKEMLRILNYLAAPFGTEEYHLINYGLKDVDHTLDANGNPNLTPKGQTDVSSSWRYLSQPMPVLYNPGDPEFVKVAYADAQALAASFVVDPSLGLYSATDWSKSAALVEPFGNGIGEIVTGRSPLSSLDSLLKDWRAGGGDQIRAEYQKAYEDARK